MMNDATTEASAQEQLSALADGELDMAQTSSLVQASRADASLMQTWASYHAIGQALRGHASDAARVHTRTVVTGVTATPTSLNAVPVSMPSVQPVAVPPMAANDSVFRWKLVAGVAAFAAVGSMVWALVGTQGSPTGAQLAQRAAPAPAVLATAPTPVESVPTEAVPVMIRDSRLDELLAAHKQFGGASALQQPAGFLRNATFQSSGR
ncbi:MAG: sigma-E factor negative regulatory protein [Burkholderiaceae bacterium]